MKFSKVDHAALVVTGLALSALTVVLARPGSHGIILTERNTSALLQQKVPCEPPPSHLPRRATGDSSGPSSEASSDTFLGTSTASSARQGRQDVRMLAANSTGTSADQALAGGVVPDVVRDLVPDAGPAPMQSHAPPQHQHPVHPDGRRVPHPGPGSSSGAADLSGEDSNIVFPTAPPKASLSPPGPPKFDPLGGKLWPNCVKGSTFCDQVDDYPSEHLQNILPSAIDKYREYFGKDALLQNVTQRIDASDEYSLCPYLENIVYPKVARTKEEKWLYIVNTDHMVQGVHIEICMKEGEACSLADNFPLGFTTSCRQKFITRRLVAINPQSGQPQKDEFVLPSCCSCHVQRTTPISSRIRSNQTPAIKKPNRKRRLI